MKLSLPPKQWCISQFHPLLKANVLLFQVKKESLSVLDQIQGSGAVFSRLYRKLYYVPLHTSPFFPSPILNQLAKLLIICNTHEDHDIT
jgi:hypothetical protein